MLRVLTLSTLYPNRVQPTLGLFVERQTIGLAARDDVDLRLASPVGVPPWPLSRMERYRRLAALPAEEDWNGVRTWRPRVRILPGPGHVATAAAMARSLLPRLSEMRREFPFDVIDAEFFWPDGVVAHRLARSLRLPFSIKARGADIHFWGRRRGFAPQIVAAGRAAGGLLAVSEAMRDDMIAIGMPADRIRVHHTGVDQDRFAPVDRLAAKRRLGIEGPLIVTAGALISRKGQRIVIDALAQLPDAQLILVGEGEDRSALEARAAPLGARVRFLGNRPHAELPALLAAADVMALASASEGLANVWVEALACGAPIVIPDIGGAREVVDRPAAGRIAARDSGAFAAAIRDLLETPPPPGAVRAAAARFTWSANTAALHRHLSAIARGGFSRAA